MGSLRLQSVSPPQQMGALFNSDNWEAYLKGFRSHFSELYATDPDRFPKDRRSGNGSWESYTVIMIDGKFQCCLGDCARVWTSKQIQVDLKFRYNFAECRGEVKISREWRQRCSQADAHPPHFVPLYVFPRLTDSGGADFAMKKVRNIIRRLYYYEEDEEENHHLRHRQA